MSSRDQHLVDVSKQLPLVQSRLDIAQQLLGTGRVNLGDMRDVDLVRKGLYCLNFGLLKKLLEAGYAFAPGRYNVAQGLPDIHGRATASGHSTDSAGGIHHPDKKIVVRTWMEDGQLQLSMSVLMHEIGHAVFETLLANEKHVLDQFRAVHKAEKDGMHRDYFKSESEFFAETFSMFSLRPDELKAKFPKTYALYREVFPLDSRWSSLGVGGHMVLANDLYFFERDMRPAILEDGTPIGALELLSRVEALNAARIGRGISPESTIFFVDGEELGVNSVIEHLGHELCMQRGQRAPFNELEGTITIDQATLNDPQALFKHLSGGLGAILYIPADLNVTYNHPFFATYREFCKRNNGMYHLAIGNRGREAEKFLEGLSDTAIHFPSSSIRLEPLDRFKLVELTRRIAVQNGYTLPQETVDKLLELVQLGGTYRDGYRVWQKIQQAYQERVTRDSASHTDVNRITPADLESAKIAQERDPLSKLESTFALQEAAVQKTKEIIALAGMKRANPDPQPLALNFEGNPGTGKTSFARLFAQSLAANQVVDSPSLTSVTTSDLISMGAQAAKKKLEEGKNGVIFIDEAHQLDPNSNPDGKKIVDLLVPMLTNPEYARTVFVFAGYPRKMDQMLSADPGFKSRVQTVPFRDYKVEELRQIAQRNLTANNVICSDQTFDALMRRIDRMQRATENPGNARDVAKTIQDVLGSQAKRLSRLPSDQVTETVRQTIELVDVVDPRQVTPDSVMKEIEQTIPGNEQLKEFLRSVEKRVAKNIEKGLPIYQNIPFEIALDGASGTGKTTLVVPLVTKFYASLGLIGQDRHEEKTGGTLVGDAVGKGPREIQAAFTAAIGGALLIDEAISLSTSPYYSVPTIKQLLTEISANRLKPQLLLFVADYPDNMDRFLSFDQGLASRFRIRITVEKISTTGALAIINRLMDENGSTLEAGSERVLEAKLNQLTTLPAFASGRDIADICKNLPNEEDENSVISRSSIERCLDQFIGEVRRRPPPKGAPATGDDVRIATATQQAPAEKREASVQKKTRQDVLDAQSKVAEKFKDLANSDHQAMATMIADPRSEYYTDLGVALGIDAQEAFETLAEVVAEIVEEYKEKDLKFDYDCPFCGGVNSMGCAYFSLSEMANPNSFVYSTEWLIQNSKKPPYESEA